MPLIRTNIRSTKDQIPLYRRQYIEKKLDWFSKEFSANNWPLDCVALIKEIRRSRKIHLQVAAASNVSNTFDAVAIYVEQQNLYQIIINKDKIRYPFLESRDRRLNFTIAHELGHIFLDHLSIPDRLKTNTERYLEDLEANEFAGNLLMPEKLMLKYNFVSVQAAAKHFNVSSAAMRRRLNNLQRLGLIDTKRIRACNCNYKGCGKLEKNHGVKD